MTFNVVKHWYILLLVVVPAFGCPDLWTTVGDGCYKASPDHMSWYDAEEVRYDFV